MIDSAILEKIQNIISTSKEYHPKAIATLSTGEKRLLRLFKSSINNLCYFAPHSSRRGYLISQLDLIDILPIEKKKPEEAIWRDSWLKVQTRLERSGLFKNLLADIKIALNIGYDKISSAYKIYWQNNKDKSYEENNKINAKQIEKIDKRLVGINEKKNIYAITSIIWYLNKPAKVKKMRFSKYDNEEKLKNIAGALKKKKKHYESGRTNYDVSFEYNPEANKAWYSEEFKGCGNGHYYLALDSTHALHYEDD